MNRGLLTRLALAAATFAAVVVVYRSAASVSPDWLDVAGLLFVFPLIAAAAWFGAAGGLVAGTAAGLVAMAVSGGLVPAVEAALYVLIGLAAGIVAERERRRRSAYEEVLRKLTAAHTELRDSFEGMKRAERLFALGQLSAGLAHEIRNPLSSIAGAARILRRSVAPGPKQTECLDIIEKESQRLNGLLTDFIDFAKPRRPEFRPVDLDGVIDAVMMLASHALSRADIALRKELEPALPQPECDAEQLQQVLLNLTINAIQASSEASEVVLAARCEAADQVTLEVRDQGSGVSPENIDRLFDPFFTTKENGTGLGLPVAHEIVRQFGGALSAHRNAGPGMTFSIVLPVHRQGANELEAHSSGR